MDNNIQDNSIQAYKLLIASENNTVLAQYEPIYSTETSYQSESELEQKLIEDLQKQGYEYVKIKNETDLKNNLRKQIERLNNIEFTEREWEQFFRQIAKDTDSHTDKTKRIQEDLYQDFQREDNSFKNIYLIDKHNIHNNHLQVINQYTAHGKTVNRYDVTILVNGFPLVHIELKKRGTNLKEAFNQIKRYQTQSLGEEEYKLFDYTQLFVISNGTETRYYSNSTRQNNSEDNTKKDNSYQFTLFWADAQNIPIKDLENFTRTFLLKHTLLNVLTRYCVFMTDRTLKVMRPYQIVAVERMLHKVKISINYPKLLGTIQAGGYIWHTTGSGKTLTSFKAAKLIMNNFSEVEKVIFVVDRQDLDVQTVQEYNKIQNGSTNASTSTVQLKKNIEEDSSKIIVTTIQKLSSFIKKNKKHPIYQKHVVLIFDECHRSQFGQMHQDLIKNFKKYNLFGFTGTPIFEENANKSTTKKWKSKSKDNVIPLAITANVFGERLHTYTITNALEDEKVLPFKIYFHRTFHPEKEIKDGEKLVFDINKSAVFLEEKRIRDNTKFILESFDTYTLRNKKALTVAEKRETGFNALFTVFSVEAAQKYYNEFAKQQKQLPDDKKLRIAIVYSQPMKKQ